MIPTKPSAADMAAIPTTVADLLAAAADRIAKYGHHKGDWRPRDAHDPMTAPCCADGALRLSIGIDPLNHIAADPRILDEAEALLAEHIIRAGGREALREDETTNLTQTIAVWNDAANNCADSVIDTLRDIADAQAETPEDTR